MKATVDITEANFKSVAEKDGIVLIDWWAPWCGPCRMFGPTYEKVAGQHPDITFGKVNTEEEQALAGAFDIRSIPTLMILRDKVLLFSPLVLLAVAYGLVAVSFRISGLQVPSRLQVVESFWEEPMPPSGGIGLPD
jgi:thioredoxin 1